MSSTAWLMWPSGYVPHRARIQAWNGGIFETNYLWVADDEKESLLFVGSQKRGSGDNGCVGSAKDGCRIFASLPSPCWLLSKWKWGMRLGFLFSSLEFFVNKFGFWSLDQTGFLRWTRQPEVEEGRKVWGFQANKMGPLPRLPSAPREPAPKKRWGTASTTKTGDQVKQGSVHDSLRVPLFRVGKNLHLHLQMELRLPCLVAN